MHVSYNRKEDILVLELSQGVVDHAEESGPLIAHFSAEGKLVFARNSRSQRVSRATVKNNDASRE